MKLKPVVSEVLRGGFDRGVNRVVHGLDNLGAVLLNAVPVRISEFGVEADGTSAGEGAAVSTNGFGIERKDVLRVEVASACEKARENGGVLVVEFHVDFRRRRLEALLVFTVENVGLSVLELLEIDITNGIAVAPSTNICQQTFVGVAAVVELDALVEEPAFFTDFAAAIHRFGVERG